MIQAVFDGVVLGSLIGLGAMSLTFIWGIERFANVATGELMTLAAYFMVLLHVTFGIETVQAGLLSIVAAAGSTLLIYLVIFRPFRNTPRLTLLVVSIGAAQVIRSLIGILGGTELRSYKLPIVPDHMLGPIAVSTIDVVIIAATMGCVVFTYVTLYSTSAGRAMRAIADAPALARVVGIRGRRVILYTWAIAGIVAAVGGLLLGANVGITPLMGWNLILPVFGAAVLGGVGNPFGAVVGGVTLGVVMQVSSQFISPSYKVAVAFLVLALALLIRRKSFAAAVAA